MKEGKRPYRVLALDGGGIRGIYTARLLEQMEKELEKNDEQLVDYFNLVVGTSTGAIIALALSLGMTAGEIREHYEKLGRDVFPKWRRKTRWGLLCPKYRSRALRKHLQQILGKKKIRDCRIPICIAAVDSTTYAPRVFKTPHADEFHVDLKLRAVDVALASSAAPGYFSAAEVKDECYVDGGLWGNNPSLMGVTEVVRIENADLWEIDVLNIGTGEPFVDHTTTKKSKATKSGALMRWRTELVTCVMLAQSKYTENVVSQLLGDGLFRVSAKLQDENNDLDNTDLIDPLKQIAQRDFRKHWKEIEARFFDEPPPISEMENFLEKKRDGEKDEVESSSSPQNKVEAAAVAEGV